MILSHHAATVIVLPSPDFSGLWWGIAAAMLVILVVLYVEMS